MPLVALLALMTLARHSWCTLNILSLDCAPQTWPMPLQSITHFTRMSWLVPLSSHQRWGPRYQVNGSQASVLAIAILPWTIVSFITDPFTFFHHLEAHGQICRPLLERASHLGACISHADLSLDLNLLLFQSSSSLHLHFLTLLFFFLFPCMYFKKTFQVYFQVRQVYM